MVDDGETVGLLHAEEVPEGGLLFGQVIVVIVVLVEGLDALEEGKGVAEPLATSLYLYQLVEVTGAQFEVEVVGYLGTIDWRNLHK